MNRANPNILKREYLEQDIQGDSITCKMEDYYNIMFKVFNELEQYGVLYALSE